MTASIYERIGGRDAVLAAVDLFYQKVLADNSINGFFASTDMDRQRGKMISFLTVAFGGPEKASGPSLREAHAPMVEKGLNDTHFDAVAGHLAATLDELGVPPDLRDEVLGLVGSLRDEVLGR